MRQNKHVIIAISNKVWYPDVLLLMIRNPQWPGTKTPILSALKVLIVWIMLLLYFKIIYERWWLLSSTRQFLGTSWLMFVSSNFRYAVFHLHIASSSQILTPKPLFFNWTLLMPFFSTEIHSTNNLSLRQVIFKHNIHIPCGDLNPLAVCMNDGACRKRFPKLFVDETLHNDLQLYMTYRRRSSHGGEDTSSKIYCTVQGASLETKIDNSRLVPYRQDCSLCFSAT